MIAEELERLERLRAAGSLTEDEYRQAKKQLLNDPADPGRVPRRIHGIEPRTWILLMHLSQLASFAAGAGIVIPVVMWAVSKDDSVEADRHGRIIINWMLSALIYVVVGVVLAFVLIGIPILVLMSIALIVFPLMGAIKSQNGIAWRYPLTIDFLKPPEHVQTQQD